MNLSPEMINYLYAVWVMFAACVALGVRIIFLILMVCYFWGTWENRKKPPTWREFINRILQQPECSRQSIMYEQYRKLYDEWDFEYTMHGFLVIIMGCFFTTEIINYWILRL